MWLAFKFKRKIIRADPFSLFFSTLNSFDLLIRGNDNSKNPDTITAWKSNRAVEKFKFLVDGVVGKEKDLLVKKKMEAAPFFSVGPLCNHPLAIYRVKKR